MPSHDENLPPVARLAEAGSATIGDLIEFDGSSSDDPDGDVITYHWSLVAPDGSAAQLTSPNYITSTLQPDVAGEYRVSLVVNDGSVDSQPAVETITVSAPVVVQNTPPVAAVAGPSTVEVGSLVRLDGSGSSDADGDGIFFDWLLEGGPAGSTARLDDPLSPSPTFTPDLPGDYELSLVVSDGTAESAPAPIVVTAALPPNIAPTADAGRDFNIATGSTALFDGSDSSDAEGASLTYQWSIVTRPAASAAALVGGETATPSMVADVDGEYVIQLIVNDGETDSAADSVSVTAVTGNVPPNANAGPNQNIEINSLVQLDGSGSYDSDGDTLSYRWMFSSRPANSNVQLANPLAVNPRFTPSAVGTYEIQLIVSDGELESAADSVTVTAVSPNGAPTADAGSDRRVRVGESIPLDGTGSADPDGDALSYAWTFAFKPAASNATIASRTSALASFQPDVVGTYTVMLTVDDGLDGAMDTVTFTVSPPWPQLEGDVVITEVMPDPSVLSDTAGEWFELYNPTSTAWDLRGCELSDLGSDSTIIDQSLVVAPMSYVALARSAAPGFGPDYVYSGFSLGNTGDEILVTCGSVEVAQLVLDPVYGFAPSPPKGASLSLLRDKMNETTNDDGANWCESTADYNGDKGTPGAPNQFQSACP